MKTLFTFLLVGTFCLLINNFSYSQLNSVELQDGGGVFISFHSSIEEAYNAIPGSISQAYIIEILTTYDGSNEIFPIDLALKTGHSDINTITIRPDAGNTGEIIASNNAAGIINIDNADYIIIDGRPGGIGSTSDLIVRNTATTGTNANTFKLLNGATNCIIKYCNSFNGTAGATGPMNMEFSASPSVATGVSNNLIENCFVSGGRTGIGSDGGPIATANPNFNNRISKCTIVDFGFTGIWLLNATAHIIVEDCFISTNNNGVSISNPYGINIQSTFDGYKYDIRRNKIIDIKSTSTSATGLNVRGIATVTAPGTNSVLNIQNNFIALNANNNNAASTFGILTTGTAESYTTNIFYNTVLIGGIQTGGIAGRLVSSGIVKASTVAGVVYNQKNNICINNRTGGTPGVVHAGCAIDATNGTLSIDYNCYFATGSSEGLNSYHARWDSTGYDNLAAYIAVSNEQNSRFKNVTFVSNTDLHLAGASIGDPDLSARPISGITTDIDGDARNANFPYKGADESTAFTLSTLNLTANLEACSMGDTITVSLRSTIAPYNLIETSKSYLNDSGIVSVNFAKAVNGVSYYIVVNHRNSIETWSKSGGEVFSGGVLNYDFTTAASQAFGSNMVLVGSEYSFYTGDVNQDGAVDLTDLSLIDNDAFNFVTGYVRTDLNCDMVVDVSDATFADNNASNFVAVVRP
ncbi:MAG: hypothetical protein M3R36_14455 [Bacteroidota bacterium]|nr:hypothetical protein [Bacteroidota bacterium]